MKALVLAAGKGTRMKEITKERPKPMVLINDKPMLLHIIDYIKKSGINEFGIVVGYKQSIIQDYFGNGDEFGISITYIEQRVQNGTGAAFHLAKNYIGQGEFFFSFGDVITPPENYMGMREYYRTNPCDVVLGLNTTDDPFCGAAVYINNENKIIRMVEKPPKGTSTTNLINAGIMIINSNVFQYTSRIKLSQRGEYELTDVFGMFLNDECCLKGYVLTGYWKDVGNPTDLAIANKIVL